MFQWFIETCCSSTDLYNIKSVVEITDRYINNIDNYRYYHDFYTILTNVYMLHQDNVDLNKTNRLDIVNVKNIAKTYDSCSQGIPSLIELMGDLKPLILSEHQKNIITLTLKQLNIYYNFRQKYVYNDIISYNMENKLHENKLKELWLLMRPNTEYLRLGSHWQDLGFQGHNPMTDFRAMGILSLDSMIYLAKNHYNLVTKEFEKQIYPYALTIIHMVKICRDILKLSNTPIEYYLFNQYEDFNHFNFHLLVTYIITNFNSYWIKCNPINILEFNSIKKKFIIHYIENKMFWQQQLKGD